MANPLRQLRPFGFDNPQSSFSVASEAGSTCSKLCFKATEEEEIQEVSDASQRLFGCSQAATASESPAMFCCNSSSQLMLISTTTRLPTWHLVFSHEKHSTDGFSHWERCFCFSPEWLWQESKTRSLNLWRNGSVRKIIERKIVIQLGFDRLKVVFQIFGLFYFFCFLGVFLSVSS